MARNASVERLKARLARVPAAARAAIDAEIEKQAGQIVTNMRLKAPVGTGTLRRSIGWKKGVMRATIMAGGEPTAKDSGAGVVRSFFLGIRDGLRGRKTRKDGKYDYAFAVEFGTQKMKAQPFFFPTWRRARGSAGKAIKASIKKAIINVR